MTTRLTHREAHEVYRAIVETHDVEGLEWPVTLDDGYVDLSAATTDRERTLREEYGVPLTLDETLADVSISPPFESPESLADRVMLDLLYRDLIECEYDYRRPPS